MMIDMVAALVIVGVGLYRFFIGDYYRDVKNWNGGICAKSGRRWVKCGESDAWRDYDDGAGYKCRIEYAVEVGHVPFWILDKKEQLNAKDFH